MDAQDVATTAIQLTRNSFSPSRWAFVLLGSLLVVLAVGVGTTFWLMHLHLELVDRTSGNSLSISLFDSEEYAVAAEPIFDEEMPRALASLFDQSSGRRTGVDRYDVLVDERAGATVG